MHNLRKTLITSVTIAVLLAQFASSQASAVSVGGGGSEPVGLYSSPVPTLSPGTYAAPQLNKNGQLVVAPATTFPVLAATTLPVSVASSVPVTAVTTFPVSGTVTVSSGSFPSVQAVAPAASSSPFAVVPYPSSSPFSITGTVNVSPSSFPSVQLVAPQPSSSPFHITCDSTCSSTVAAGQYNAILPTYSSGQSVVPQYDSNGRALFSPLTITLPTPFPISGQYNLIPSTVSTGSSTSIQTDPQGYLFLSPYTAIVSGGAEYTQNPIPLLDGQIVQARTDQFGNTVVTASTPLPMTLNQQQTIIDRSNKIVVASTGQQIMSENQKRNGLIFQNNCSSAIWINILGIMASGAAPDFQVAANTTFVTPPFMSPKGIITVYSSTVNCPFTAEEF